MIREGQHSYIISKKEKFPVTTEMRKYKVVIKSKIDFIDIQKLICKVLVKNDRSGLFRRKFIEVYRVTHYLDGYEDNIINLIKFAENTVSEYENTLVKEYKHYNDVKKSVREFEEWDGKIRKE